MPICSYLVFPRPGCRDRVADALAALPGCEVIPAERHDLLILLTSSPDAPAEEALRQEVEAVEDVQCLALSFGDVDPGAVPADPGGAWRSSPAAATPAPGAPAGTP